MSTADEQYENIEQFLKRIRPPEPSVELRERITGAARKAWEEPLTDIPWQVPIRRLAMSAAAAIVIVSTTNFFSNRAVVRWRADRPAVARAPAVNYDETGELPYGPFVEHLLAVRRSSTRDPWAVIDRAERLREAFQEIEQRIDDADRSDPTGFKSRLIPTGSSPSWHA